ncbi:unnamed protein product, partial [Musa banksii]
RRGGTTKEPQPAVAATELLPEHAAKRNGTGGACPPPSWRESGLGWITDPRGDLVGGGCHSTIQEGPTLGCPSVESCRTSRCFLKEKSPWQTLICMLRWMLVSVDLHRNQLKLCLGMKEENTIKTFLQDERIRYDTDVEAVTPMTWKLSPR